MNTTPYAHRFLLLGCVCFAALACSETKPSQDTPTPQDTKPTAEKSAAEPAKDAKPDAAKTPAKLVTLGGAITEIAFALGRGPEIVATDVSSLYPKEAHALPKAGYYRKISAEPLLAMSPTHVIADKDTGPKSALDQLQSAGVQVTTVPLDSSPEGAIQRIEALGVLLERPKEAKALQDTLRKDLDKAKACAQSLKHPPKVLFLYARGMKTLLVSGKDTTAHEMIALAGATNAAGGFEGFKPLTPEAVVQAQPDVVLVPQRGLKSLEDAGGVWSLPGMAQTPAAKNKAVIAMDDLALLGFGPRMGNAVNDLCEGLKKYANPPE